MGLLRTLFLKLSGKLSKIGNTEPVCPYCSHELPKMPGRKKKCPACGQYMLVRTRPRDQKRILVRQDQADVVEEQWAIVRGSHAQLMAERAAYEAERKRLAKQSGREPSNNEVRWSLLNKENIDHASKNNWGFYRSNIMLMGDILKSDGKNESALKKYLEVCYLDLNGPNNCQGMRDPELLAICPPFNPKDGMLAPGIVGYVCDMLDREGLKKREIRDRFLDIARKLQQSLRLTVEPDKAWRKLSKEIGADF